jgi:SAM-dependent methyltransferase
MASGRNDAQGDPVKRRVAARRLAEHLRRERGPLDDDAFDRFLPRPLKEVSPQYWSSLAVAQRAAEWLDEAGVQSIVDIGSGAGKFCVAAAIFGQCRFIGLEHRPGLVDAARNLACLFDVHDRVSFVHGALGAARLPTADAYYLFNPFGQYWFGSDRLMETDAGFTQQPRTHDIAIAERLLRRVATGTWLLTYNGFGGRVPAGYRLIRTDWELRAPLRLWRKERWESVASRPTGDAPRSDVAPPFRGHQSTARHRYITISEYTSPKR